MIDPTQSVSHILENNPDLAQDLIDLLICATSPGFKDSKEYDEIKDLCWMNTQMSRDARDRYIAGRAAA